MLASKIVAITKNESEVKDLLETKCNNIISDIIKLDQPNGIFSENIQNESENGHHGKLLPFKLHYLILFLIVIF